MQDDPTYTDVVHEVCDFLVRRATRARKAGIEEVWVDPGLGFGKTAAHNLSLLRHLDVLVGTGFPVLIGASRKRFLGSLLATADGRPDVESVPPEDRIEGSIGAAVWAIVQGARMVRVHDVRATVHAVKVVAG
jgi:dihydropteroate synthase